MIPHSAPHQTPRALTFLFAGRRYRVEGIPEEWKKEIPQRLLSHIESRVNQSEHHETTGLAIELLAEAEHLRPPPIGHDLNETSRMFYSEESVAYRSDWCQAEITLKPYPSVTLQCHREAGPWFGGVLENALRITVAYDVLQRGGLLMHSACIIKSGRAHVLFGHSGAGKSTCSQAALDAGYQVLSDDINVVLPERGEWSVLKLPFCGSVGGSFSSRTSYPLDRLYGLYQCERSFLANYTPAEAVASVCGSAPFVNQDPFRTAHLLDNAQSVIGGPSVRKLYFRRDKSFLRLLDREPQNESS